MITQEQAVIRKRYIGSSDVAAICGLDHYRSAADVWLEKTGQVEAFAGNEHTERGNLLEPVVLNWAENRLGLKFVRDVMAVSECGLLAANFDGINAIAEPVLAESKTTVTSEEWGEEGTDEVPDRVVCQAHHQMYVAGPDFRVCWVPVLMAGFRSFDFKLYRVDRNDDLAERLADQARTFMQKFVRGGNQPDDYKPSLEVLKRIRRQPNKTIDLPAEIVTAWTAAKEAAANADKAKKAAEMELLKALGDAEAGNFAGGVVTYLESTRKAYSVEACTYRQLRLVKPKAAKALVKDQPQSSNSEGNAEV